VAQALYPPIVARQRLSRDVTTTSKICWRRRFLCGLYFMRGNLAISSFQNFLFLGQLSFAYVM
jgi:hypothetical protein